MAAPHVTGAAGLLFSLKPTATVTEARDALLGGVDTIPSLDGETSTGGRLDVAKAMESLVPSEPEVPTGEFKEAEKKIEQANPPAPIQPPPAPVCKVPKLAGETLGQATAALKAAHCTLGKVKKPKAKKGHRLGPLAVKSTNPAPGSLSSGKVNLTLGPKPKPKKHHH